MQIDTGISGFDLEEIDSEADFVLLSAWQGVLSEHCTLGEARMAKYKEAGKKHLGEQLPVIYQRSGNSWVPVR